MVALPGWRWLVCVCGGGWAAWVRSLLLWAAGCAAVAAAAHSGWRWLDVEDGLWCRGCAPGPMPVGIRASTCLLTLGQSQACFPPCWVAMLPLAAGPTRLLGLLLATRPAWQLGPAWPHLHCTRLSPNTQAAHAEDPPVSARVHRAADLATDAELKQLLVKAAEQKAATTAAGGRWGPGRVACGGCAVANRCCWTGVMLRVWGHADHHTIDVVLAACCPKKNQ